MHVVVKLAFEFMFNHKRKYEYDQYDTLTFSRWRIVFYVWEFSHQRACSTSFAYTSVNAGKSSSHTRDILSKYRKIAPRKFVLKYILNIVLKKLINTHFHFK